MKTYVIYLPDILHTRNAAMNCLSSCSEYGIDAELYEGYLPSAADKFISERGLKPFSDGHKLYDIKNSKPGVRGCFVSHYTLWEKCAASDSDFMILEHDAKIVNPLQDFEFQDVLHLDAWRFQENPVMEGEPVQDYERLKKGHNIFEGAYSYILKPHAARKLIECVKTQGWTAVDMIISSRAELKLQNSCPRVATVTDRKSLTSDRNFNL